MREAQRLVRRASRRHPLLPMLVPALLAAALALALPVAAPDDGRARRAADAFAAGATTTLATENLAAFRSSERWGLSLQTVREREQAEAARLEAERLARERARQQELAGLAAAGQSAWSPELQAIGFVGVVITAAQRVVLLTLPTGGVERFRVGDELKDGRRLAAISAQALVLQHDAGEQEGTQETLPLFPPVPPAPPMPPARAAAGAGGVADVASANAATPPTEGE